MFWLRVLIGVIQGGLLSLMPAIAAHHSLSIAIPLLVTCTIVPLAISAGLTTIRTPVLGVYSLVLAAILGLTCLHVANTQTPDRHEFIDLFSVFRHLSVNGPYVFAFLAQALVTAGDGERRLFASYPRYFDAAWKLAVQAILSGVFTGAFWLLLWLGVGLFDLLDLKFFQAVITNRVFACVATAVVFSAAIHVTDVKPNIIRGIRTLKLTLFAWLLPVMTFIAAAFLLTLCVVGFASLNRTHATGYIFIGVGFILVYLVNAAYQDGAEEQTKARVLRLSGIVAAMLPAVFAALAAYRMYVRIGEDGLTDTRVYGIAAIAVLACYAGGYVAGIFSRDGWLRRLEPTNIAAALLTMCLYILLFSPIADPSRLSVDEQLHRLRAGKIAPEKFDYAYLKRDAGTYGTRALTALKADPNPSISLPAARMLNEPFPGRGMPVRPVITSEQMGQALKVFPEGQTLPSGFLDMDWNQSVMMRFQNCTTGRAHCEAYIVPPVGDGTREVLVSIGIMGPVDVFARPDGKTWQRVGMIDLPWAKCDALRDALRAGTFESAPASYNGLVILGHRFAFQEQSQPFDCR